MAQLDVAEVRRKVKGKSHNPFDYSDDEEPTISTKKQLFPSTNPFDDEESSQALPPAQIARIHEGLNANPFDTDEPTSSPPQGLPKSSSRDTLKKLEVHSTESKDHPHFINHKPRYSFHSHKEKVSSSHLKNSSSDGPRFPPVFKKSSMGSKDFRELFGQGSQDEDSKPQRKGTTGGTRSEELFVDEAADFVSAQKAKDLFGYEGGQLESSEKGNGLFGLVDAGFGSTGKSHHVFGNDDLRAGKAHKTREESVFKDTDTALSQKHKDMFSNKEEEDHEDYEPTAPSTDFFVNKALADLEDYAMEKSEDTTASIMTSLKIAEDTRAVAGTTLETLHYQGAQIERTHEKAVKLDQHLQVGEKLLNSLGGIFSKSWKPKKSHKITGPMIGKAESSKRRGSLADRAALGLTDGLKYADTKAAETSKRRGSLADRAALGLTEDPNYAETKATFGPSVHQEPANFQSRLEIERKTQDDALSDLGNVVGQLKEMSSEMHTETVRQMEGLDHLHDDVHELVSRVHQSNIRGQKLLRR